MNLKIEAALENYQVTNWRAQADASIEPVVGSSSASFLVQASAWTRKGDALCQHCQYWDYKFCFLQAI